MSYTQTTHPDDLNNDAELGVKLFHGEIPSYTVQKRYITRAGATIWVELNARLIRDQDDKPKYALITYQDITDRKKTEAALLEREAELARSNNELQRFAYIASHDLQEPLRTVSLYTDLIARRYKQHLDPDADEFIGYVVSATLRMKRLIHDLLEYSRVSAAGREPQPTDCTVVLERSLANLHAAIESASANVTHDSLPTVCSDPLQLEQVFQNLIGNAIKFRSQSPPQIHVSAERQDGMWRLSVSDNGIGIDPRYQERIFEVFQRLHPNASFEGTGIGLAVCKRIIEQHGGRIWVQSQPGHGSTFYFTCKSV
jgi:light-regulated signal transduction histidine kinase (bacteriophytochrome)